MWTSNYKFIPISFLCLCIALPSCAPRTIQLPPVNYESLSELQGMNAPRYRVTARSGANGFRNMALQETALSLGARAGLAKRAKEINKTLETHARDLDTSFNFQSMLLEHNVLPPVLLQGDNTLNLDNDTAIRIADRTFKIDKQARFATTPPNWRDYLYMNFEQPEYPHVSLLPHTLAEQRVWRFYVTKGWNDGLKQANSIFEENLARLRQDYNGMVLYRRLLAQNMVSAPFVAKTDLGVTGDGNRMNINDQVLRISALPALQPNNNPNWKAAVTTSDATLNSGWANGTNGAIPGKDANVPSQENAIHISQNDPFP